MPNLFAKHKLECYLIKVEGWIGLSVDKTKE